MRLRAAVEVSTSRAKPQTAVLGALRGVTVGHQIAEFRSSYDSESLKQWNIFPEVEGLFCGVMAQKPEARATYKQAETAFALF